MRDMIYYHLDTDVPVRYMLDLDPLDEEEEVVRECEDIFQIEVRGTLATNALSISKQFSGEYKKQKAGKATLTIIDHQDAHWQLPPMGDKKFAGLSRAKIFARMHCDFCWERNDICRNVTEIRSARELVHDIVQQHDGIKEVEMVLHLSGPEEPAKQWPDTLHTTNHAVLSHELVKIENIEKLTAYKIKSGNFDVEEGFSPDRLYVSWTNESGWQSGTKEDMGSVEESAQ